MIDASTGALLGLVERERAYSTVHEGAVYLHLGEPYLVRELDLHGTPHASSSRSPATGTRRRRRRRRRTSSGRSASSAGSGWSSASAVVSVTERVVAYQRKSIRDGSTIATVQLDLPPTTFETEAVWYVPTARQLDGLEEMPMLISSLHAAEHSMIALLPLWAMCDRWDIGGLSTNVHQDTGAPTVFVYDGHPGGVGISERGFDQFEGWVADTARMLAGCPCEHGCPSCVQSPKCGNLNEFLDKGGALTLLRRMLAS